jgi:trk system potassium uptake protein TrkA
VLVIGLGRFGSAVATTLVSLGREVLAVDTQADLVQRIADTVTHAVQADATDLQAMQQLGAADFSHAVVAIGHGVEASVLSTSVLVDLGIGTIWAKAITREHGRILERIGAHRVTYPESEAGERVAHLVSDHLLDYIRFEDDFAVVKMLVPPDHAGQTLAAAHLRRTYDVTVVGIKAPGQAFTYATPETELTLGSTLAVAGPINALEAFARTT